MWGACVWSVGVGRLGLHSLSMACRRTGRPWLLSGARSRQHASTSDAVLPWHMALKSCSTAAEGKASCR